MTMSDYLFNDTLQYTKSLKADFQCRAIFKTTCCLIAGFCEHSIRIVYLCK